MPPGSFLKSPHSIALRLRMLIFVDSAICSSEIPRFRRMVAKPKTLPSSSCIRRFSHKSAVTQSFYEKVLRKTRYHISDRIAKLLPDGYLPQAVRGGRLGWTGWLARQPVAGVAPPAQAIFVPDCGPVPAALPRQNREFASARWLPRADDQ